MSRITFLLCVAASLLSPTTAGAQVSVTVSFDPRVPAEALETLRKTIRDPELFGALDDIKKASEHYHKAEYDKAEQYDLKALAVLEKRAPASALSGMAHGLLAIHYINLGDSVRAEPHARLYLRYARTIPKSIQIAGVTFIPQMEESLLEVNRALALLVMGLLLERRGEYAEAEKLDRESLAIWRRQFPKKSYPNGHFTIVVALTKIAEAAAMRGDYEAARDAAADAVAELNPFLAGKEVPAHDMLSVANALSTLSEIQRFREEYASADDLERQAIAIYDKYIPQDHPTFAMIIRRRATSYFARGKRMEAERLLSESRNMLTRRFPNGLPQLAALINDQGYLCAANHDYDEAEKYSLEALAMADRLFPNQAFPNGHPAVTGYLNQLGFLSLRQRGGAPTAARYFREAARITIYHTTSQSQLLSETETLNLMRRSFLDALSGLLTATADGPFDPRDYLLVWGSKATAMRALELRHRALLSSTNSTAQKLADELEVMRAELSARLLAPVEAGKPDDATARASLAALSAKKEGLERLLNDQLGLTGSPPGDAPHPFDLAKYLPASAAFVDFIRYNRVVAGPGVPGLTSRPDNPHYAAFVFTRGARPARVELGPAGAVEAAIETWRESIASPGANERWAADKVRQLLWQPIAARLPDGLDTIYLSPDAALNRTPFGALPGRRAEVLLEEVTIEVVPHGPFLLERLTTPAPARGGRALMLTVGGVDYGKTADGKSSPYAPLGFSATEFEAIAALPDRPAAMEIRTLAGARASVSQVLAELPRLRIVHISTHGFFLGEKEQTKFGLNPAAFRPGPRDLRTPQARNPLVLSGLALAGANRTAPAADLDRGLLTAESIAGRRLAEMDLAVLSACETGLGTEVGREGVFGLQRAFHLAGCRTVVASLWKVDDAATSELMKAFYRHLWGGGAGTTPARAMRAAQLELLWRCKDGFNRGNPRPRAVVMPERFPPSRLPAPAAGTRYDADTYFWAGFVVSG
jgi:CHAT domain-containing protein